MAVRETKRNILIVILSILKEEGGLTCQQLQEKIEETGKTKELSEVYGCLETLLGREQVNSTLGEIIKGNRKLVWNITEQGEKALVRLPIYTETSRNPKSRRAYGG